MEWNWDWAWWKSPRRVVQPTKPDASRDTRKPQQPVAEEASAAADQKALPADDLVPGRRESRPFYQLYLSSVDVPASAERGERRIRLRSARARTCATALEMLCVPLGRSGNPDDCYLLYEDRGEFEWSAELAAMLDVPALTKPAPAAGPEDAFRAGLGLMYGLIESGAIVERPLIEAAEKRLAEALQAEPLPVTQRWVAGILTSRLAADYRYDYSSAQSYAAQAERLVAADSLEQMTAIFWRADSLAQEGKTSDAALLYQRVVERYGPRVNRSQLVQQAKAGVREKRRR